MSTTTMMSAAPIPLRNVGIPQVDFTDENLSGLRGVSYTSFEQRQQAPALPGIGALYGQRATRSIDLSLGTKKNKSVASRLTKNTNQKETVVDLTIKPQNVPAQLSTYLLTVDPNKMVCFYGRDHYLSNYYTAPMTVNGVAYRTVEHYYEACKLFSFGGFQWSSQLNIVKDPGAVKVTAKRLMSFVDKRRVEAWKRSEGLAVIENGLMHKFTQHTDLCDRLLATGDSFLAQCNPYDTLWGTGLNTEKVKQWATTNAGTVIKVPRRVAAKTLPFCVTIGDGQNALGYLLMQVRHVMLKKREGGAVSAHDSADDSVEELDDDAITAAANEAQKEEKNVLSPESTKNVEDICFQLAKINVQQQQKQ